MGSSFQHNGLSGLFAGLALLLLLFWSYWRWKKKVTRRTGDASLVRLLIAGHSPRHQRMRFAVLLLAFVFGVLAAMNLRRPGEKNAASKKGIDIVLALDVSKSMLAADLAPGRLERAKQFLGKLLDALPDDRVALVVFAGKAYLQMPFTTDHGAAQLYIGAASPELVPQQGTVISDALQMSARAFSATAGQLKTVVLITDGEDHDDAARSTAKELAQQGVMINAVGIGSPEGASIPDPLTGGWKKDEAGNTILSRLNEPELKELASLTNGTYVRLQSSDEAVKQITRQLASVDRKQFTDQSQLTYHSYYMWFAAAMLLFLLAELFIPENKKLLPV